MEQASVSSPILLQSTHPSVQTPNSTSAPTPIHTLHPPHLVHLQSPSDLYIAPLATCIQTSNPPQLCLRRTSNPPPILHVISAAFHLCHTMSLPPIQPMNLAQVRIETTSNSTCNFTDSPHFIAQTSLSGVLRGKRPFNRGVAVETVLLPTFLPFLVTELYFTYSKQTL